MGQQTYPMSIQISQKDENIYYIMFSADDVLYYFLTISPNILIECAGQVLEAELVRKYDTDGKRCLLVGIKDFKVNIDVIQKYNIEKLVGIVKKTYFFGAYIHSDIQLWYQEDLLTSISLVHFCERYNR